MRIRYWRSQFPDTGKQKIPILASIVILALAILACGQYVTSTGTSQPSPASTESPDTGSDTGTPSAIASTEAPDTGTPDFPYTAEVFEPLTIRTGAGEEYQALGYLDPGDTVTVFGLARAEDGGSWARIIGGYVNNKYLSKK